jgi:hypothetical protein
MYPRTKNHRKQKNKKEWIRTNGIQPGKKGNKAMMR